MDTAADEIVDLRIWLEPRHLASVSIKSGYVHVARRHSEAIAMVARLRRPPTCA